MLKNNRDILRQWVNLLAIIGAFLINVFSNLRPINGLSIGEISNTFFGDVLIIPASYAFIIWGLIYVGLIALAVYQVLPANRQVSRELGYFLTVSSLAQIVWVIWFQLRWFAASILPMVIILISLILLYLRLENKASNRWLVQRPVSVYLGWISVATIVNIASVLADIAWQGWGISALGWTIVMMAVATVLGVIACLKRRDLVYSGVIVWALVAISVRHLAMPVLAIASLVLAVGLVLLMVRVAVLNNDKNNLGNPFSRENL